MTENPFSLDRSDAFGAELFAYYLHKDPREIVERDDGYIDCVATVPSYFQTYEEWPEYERQAIQYAHGRTVDVGCGAGRVSLYLQDSGRDVLGIDTSEGALELCRRRGVRAVRNLPFAQIDNSLAPVDSWVFFGNNFGLFAGRSRAVRLLRRMQRLSAKKDAVIIAESSDPYRSKDPERRAYCDENLRKGRMFGQLRMRVRHGRSMTPWFDYLLVSREEMQNLVMETGWSVVEFIDGPEPSFIGILRKR